MLAVRSLHVAIDSVVALRGLSLDVADGRMVGLVGRNGAGKTTLMRTLMGHLVPTSGSVELDGNDLLALPAHARAALGIGYMPEDRAAHVDVLAPGELRVESRSDLEQRPDPAPKDGRSRGRCGDPRQDLEERRLAGAVPADHADDVACRQLE